MNPETQHPSPAAPTSTTHRCMNAISTLCTRGNGKPRSKRCRYCGSALLTSTGTWCTFVWQGENRYALADAVGTFRSEAAARRAADAGAHDNLVVRFVVA